MSKFIRLGLQAILYTIFGMTISYHATQPAHQHLDPDMALIKLNFSHAGAHKRECIRLSPEEIAKLAQNMRRSLTCPRERVPVVVEIILDGEVLFHASLPPSGLAGDGESTVYQRFPVASGKHVIIARLRDSRRKEGFDYEHQQEIYLQPQQNFVLDFKPETGGFIFL